MLNEDGTVVRVKASAKAIRSGLVTKPLRRAAYLKSVAAKAKVAAEVARLSPRAEMDLAVVQAIVDDETRRGADVRDD